MVRFTKSLLQELIKEEEDTAKKYLNWSQQIHEPELQRMSREEQSHADYFKEKLKEIEDEEGYGHPYQHK